MKQNLSTSSFSFKVYTENTEQFQTSYGIDILFSLQGDNRIFCEGKTIRLSQGGMFVSNQMQFYHNQLAENGEIVILHIKRDFLKITGIDGLRISCHTPGIEKPVDENTKRLREFYAEIFELRIREQNEAAVKKLVDLLIFLKNNFIEAGETTDYAISERNMDRIKHILDYVNEHYQDNLRISDLASQEYLTPNYLSRFFQEKMHCTLSEYITRLRILHAQDELLNSDLSVTHIGGNSGFQSTSAFIRAFQKQVGMTPKEFRRKEQSKSDHLGEEESLSQGGGELPDEFDSALRYLLSFLPKQVDLTEVSQKSARVSHISVNALALGRTIHKSWKTLLNVAYARDLLLNTVQEAVKQAQREIGFRYLRCHGFFDDDMHVYLELPDGSISLNFTYIDLVIDFVLGQGLIPFIDLTYVPVVLAKRKNSPYLRMSCLSVPNSYKKWNYLVENTVQHLVTRYGYEEVATWKFTTLAMSLVMSRNITEEEYYHHYSKTYHAVKKICPDTSFGGPSAFAGAAWEGTLLENFLKRTLEENCVPDFFSIKDYPHQNIADEEDFMKFISNQQSVPAVLTNDPHFTLHLSDKLHEILRKYNLETMEIWYEEWNSNIWQHDLTSETTYKAAWMLKDICESFDRVQAFGYMPLSDLFDEHPISSMFSGGPGLFTYRGVQKTGWQAYRMLSCMGDVQLARGNGFLVTKSDQEIQILLYHCANINNLYRFRYVVPDDPEDAYAMFVETKAQQYHIHIQNVGKTCEITQYLLNRQNGSTFDAWLRMGASEQLTREQMQRISNAAECMGKKYQIEYLNGEFDANIQLDMNECKLITVKNVE